MSKKELIEVKNEELYNLTTTFGDIRCVMLEGKSYMVGKDVAKCLDYKNTKQAIQNIIPDDEKLRSILQTSGQRRSMILISESGLYRLALRSKKPQAKKFADWVVKDVLPSIRKTGSYTANDIDISDEYSDIMKIGNPRAHLHMYIEKMAEHCGCTKVSAWVLLKKIIRSYKGLDIDLIKSYVYTNTGMVVTIPDVLERYGTIYDAIKILEFLATTSEEKYNKAFTQFNVPKDIMGDIDNANNNTYIKELVSELDGAKYNGIKKINSIGKVKSMLYSSVKDPVPTPFSIAEGF